MTEVLNFYLQKYGLLEPKLDDIQIVSNEKAKKRWDMVRKCIRSVSALVDKSDLRNSKISHGIKFLRRINNNYQIEQISYLAMIDSYLTLDGHSIRILDSEGKYKQSFLYNEIEVSFKRLQWANISERFIAWTPGTTDIAMLDKSFKVLEIVDEGLVDTPIFQLSYNEDKNEIISSHVNKIITWQFRYANKHLIPKTNIPLNLKNGAATIYHLEKTQSKYQRLFVANDCGVIIVCISSGLVLNEHSTMHERPITALTFFNPLKLLVTGCKDGSIKVWFPTKIDMELRMVFVGHTASVTALAIFPGGCQATVASSGNDKTLRVWSLEINDEIECIELEYSPRFLGAEISKMTFFTVDWFSVDMWYQNHIFDDLLSLSSPATRIDSYLEGGRGTAIKCKNNLLFLICADKSCDPITKTMVSRHHLVEIDRKDKVKVTSTVYHEATQTLFTLINKNIIIQYSTNNNPMKLRQISQCNLEEDLLLLSLYEIKNYTKSKDKSLLISGSSKGSIIVHSLQQPENVLFKIDGHAGAAVMALICNTDNSKMFTSGYDNSIKVWHVYPFASEPLTMELSFYCGHLPIHLANIGSHLFTVFHDADGAQFPTVIYNITDRSRHDHSPNDDHIEAVTSVSAATKMKLFLSSSAGTENLIKIWTCKNVLLRQIEVHFTVNCAAFCSEKADILVSVGNQICRIDHNSYMPRAYIKKQVLMHFKEIDPAKCLKEVEFEDEECQKMFTAKECEMIKGIKSIFKYENYEDILPESEAKEVAERNDLIGQSYEKIQSTEDDIRRLQLGQCKKSVAKYDKYVERPKKSDVLNAYLTDIMRFYKIPPPKEIIDDSKEIGKQRQPDKYKSNDKEGFFPSHKSIDHKIASKFTNINTAGYLPNSTILNKLWPTEFIREKADVWKAPMLSTLDRALARLKEIAEVEEDTPRFFDWGSNADEKDVGDKEIDDAPSPDERTITELSEDVLSKFGSLLKPPESTLESVETEAELEPEKEVVKRPASTRLTRETLKLPSLSRAPATMPDLRRVKFEAPSPQTIELTRSTEIQQVSDMEPSPQTDSPFFLTESRIKERPTPVSVLPRFLLRFADEKWFQKLCPPPHDNDICLVNLPTPLTATNFCKQIIQLIQSSKEISDVITFINVLEHIYTNDDIEKLTVLNIHALLEKKSNDLRELDDEKKINLLKACLKLMVTLEGVPDKAVVLTCLSRYFDADEQLRMFMKSLLCHLGLEDDDNIIYKELDNFKLYSVSTGSQRIVDLQAMVSDWLHKWYQSMLNFAKECRSVIGEEMHLLNSNFFKPSRNVTLQLEKVMEIFHLNVTSPVDLMQLYPTEKSSTSVLTYVNCLNFVRHKLSRKKQRQPLSNVDTYVGDDNKVKKTIVSLPKLSSDKQCLVRLGESYADQFDVVKRRDFSLLNSMWSKTAIADQTQHPAMQPLYHYQLAVGGGFVPYMHLRMKPCLVNPFPRPEDVLEWESINSKSLFLSAKQSFIPQFSLPPEPF